MPATDDISGIEAKVVAVIAPMVWPADGWLVKSVIDYNNDNGKNRWPQPETVSDGDLPEFDIDLEQADNPEYSSTIGYGDTAAAGVTDHPLDNTYVFRLTLTCSDTRALKATTYYARLRGLLRAAGPTLGLSYVNYYSLTMQSDVERDQQPPARGTLRRIITTFLTVHTVVNATAEQA